MEGVLPLAVSADVRQVGSPLTRTTTQSSSFKGSPLCAGSFEVIWSVFEFGDPSLSSMVLDNGEELGMQDHVGKGNLDPIIVPTGLHSDLVLSQEGAILRDGECRDVALCLVDEIGRDGEDNIISPLGAYLPISVGEPGHTNWVVQCVKVIYPIVGISWEGHKLQVLALLTFLEEER